MSTQSEETEQDNLTKSSNNGFDVVRIGTFSSVARGSLFLFLVFSFLYTFYYLLKFLFEDFTKMQTQSMPGSIVTARPSTTSVSSISIVPESNLSNVLSTVQNTQLPPVVQTPLIRPSTSEDILMKEMAIIQKLKSIKP